MNLKKLRTLTALGASTLVLGGGIARADDVTDTIDEALEAYKDQDYSGAADALQAAAQMVRQKKAEGLTQFLPEAPDGWTAADADSNATAGSFMGGTSAEREYTKDAASVKVQFITDSPMLQSFMMMANMPMMAGGNDSKIERIKRQKAILKYDAGDQSGTINIVVDGKLLVQIEGNGVSNEELHTFAEAINYKDLEDAL